MTADDYISQLGINTDKENARKDGIFTYILDNNDDKKIAIASVSELLNLTAFTNQPAVSLTQGGSREINDYIFPKVETWIKSIHDAKFVITDSFHGCVFSIIFNKPFLAIGNQHRGQARFESLLKLFNLDDRLITHSSQITTEKIERKIDWPLINSIIESQKKQSLNYLKKNLKNTL
ncbi:Polysaccharide pyruvyl transferase [compost metagenome]